MASLGTLDGQALKLLRLKRNMRQADLAEACGISTAYISRLEAGERTPSLDVVQRLTAVLGTEEFTVQPEEHPEARIRDSDVPLFYVAPGAPATWVALLLSEVEKLCSDAGRTATMVAGSLVVARLRTE